MKLEKVRDVKVPISVVLGEAELSLGEVAAMGAGTIIELSRPAGEPVDLLAAGELIARGEVVVIEENFGIRVTEVLKREA
jgi:flagellar motor switch protein FliN